MSNICCRLFGSIESVKVSNHELKILGHKVHDALIGDINVTTNEKWLVKRKTTLRIVLIILIFCLPFDLSDSVGSGEFIKIAFEVSNAIVLFLAFASQYHWNKYKKSVKLSVISGLVLWFTPVVLMYINIQYDSIWDTFRDVITIVQKSWPSLIIVQSFCTSVRSLAWSFDDRVYKSIFSVLNVVITLIVAFAVGVLYRVTSVWYFCVFGISFTLYKVLDTYQVSTKNRSNVLSIITNVIFAMTIVTGLLSFGEDIDYFFNTSIFGISRFLLTLTICRDILMTITKAISSTDVRSDDIELELN